MCRCASHCAKNNLHPRPYRPYTSICDITPKSAFKSHVLLSSSCSQCPRVCSLRGASMTKTSRLRNTGDFTLGVRFCDTLYHAYIQDYKDIITIACCYFTSYSHLFSDCETTLLRFAVRNPRQEKMPHPPANQRRPKCSLVLHASGHEGFVLVVLSTLSLFTKLPNHV